MRTTPNRFRVERDASGRLLILDTVDCKYTECPPHTTRAQAEQQCALRNGGGRQKTSEPAELPALREKLRREGILSRDEFEALNRPRTKDLISTRRPLDPRRIEQFCKSLPGLLRAWASELAHQSGIGGGLRRSMRTDEVIATVAGADYSGVFSFSHRATETLAEKLGEVVDWTRLEDEGFRGVLAVHYLSNEPARLKASYLGVSERSYFRKLAEAHQSLAGSLAQTFRGVNDFDYGSVEAIKQYNANPDYTRDDDDDYAFRISREDMANLGSVQKLFK